MKTILTLTLALAAVAALAAGAGPRLAKPGAFDCGDVPGPGWRCFVVDAHQLGPALQDLDTGGCLVAETIGVAPWHKGTQDGSGFVSHYVVYGLRADEPCFP